MIRVLNIIGSLNIGGAETFLINLYRNIDKEKIQFDFAICDAPSENSYYNEVIESGGKVYIIPPKSKGMLKNFRSIKNIVKKNNYKMVWRYTDSCFGAIDLLAAKSGGASETVLNSRSSYTDNTIQRILHYIVKPFVPYFVTKNYACGIKAGKWMFGKHPFEVINNGVNVENFRYSEEIRNQHRQEFQIRGKTVVGHVGRFHPAKNHKLIIEIFERFKEKVPESVLVLIGIGELRTQIEELVKSKNMENDVLFLGNRNDVPEMLQMMDIFIMPSLFEGFPRSCLEAQTAGLPCIVSTAISEEIDVSGNVSFIDLDAPVETWVDALVEKCGSKKEDNIELVRTACYDIAIVAKRIEAYIIDKEEKLSI